MAVKSFSLGMAVGYVLGARAGERRYEQIVNWSQKLLDSPLVGRLTTEGREMAMGKARDVVDTVKARGFMGSDNRQEARADDGGDRDDDEDDRQVDDGYDEGDEAIGRRDDDDDETGRDDDDYDDDEQSYARADGGEDGYEDDAGEDEDEDEEAYARHDDEGDRRQQAEPDERDEDDDEEARAGLGSKLGGLVSAARERGRVD